MIPHIAALIRATILMATPAALAPARNFKPLDCQTVSRGSFGPQRFFGGVSNFITEE
jgi:hypothetical protein